jgi:DNA-binding NarL/FixJ family response regulator
MYDGSEQLRRAAQAGVRGYVLKESSGEELVKAVRAVAAGDHYTNLLSAPCFQKPEAAREPLDMLSTREREVLQLVVEGHPSAEIAQRLSLSRKTVETYRSRLMKKLDLQDVPALVKFALQQGVITLK